MYGGKAGLHLDPDVSLNDIVNVFECCVLNWEAFSIMLPAFVMAGAITVFVPPPVLLKFFGASAKRSVAYSTAAISGFFLSVCSCNIVPLFISIYRRGAGLGPAITFLYAGPAINLVSLIFVYQVIGWRLGFWRLVGVPVIAVVIGIMMAFVFRREEAAREKEAQAAAALSVHTHPTKRIVTLFALLFAMMIIGSIKQTEISLLTWPIKIAVMVGIAGLTAFLSWKWFDVEELKDWGMETWKLVRVIVPVLIVSVLIIGYIATAVKLTTLQKLGITSSTGDNIWSALIVATFGSFMYFPILSEVAFTKAFLKMNDLETGLALILLLTGSGLSLPGMYLIARAIGVKKVAVYVGVLILLTAVAGLLFGKYIGDFVCPCVSDKPDPFPLWLWLNQAVNPDGASK